MSTAPPTVKKSRKTHVARPERPLEVRLPYLRKSLASQIKGGFLEKAVKTTDKILALTPTSPSILLTKVSLLLHLDNYSSALALLDSSSPETLSNSSAGFERAYCLYKLGREDEAEKVLQSVKGEAGEGGEFLEAQLAFRRHDYAASSDIYTSLLSHYPESHPAHTDLLSNLTLSDSLTSFLSSGYLDQLRDAEDTLDIDDLEELVPNVNVLPAQPVASGSTLPSSAPVVAEKTKSKKRRHALPKGAVESEAGTFKEDPERWLPLRARTTPPVPNPNTSSNNNNNNKKPAQQQQKGKKEGMGTGMTQGSVNLTPIPASGGGGGGGKKKKGKK
ncbi:hypothetical protein BDY24DRAFT_434801 [Mrakia frigida]|uniref:signal recognition particle subunit SRP72 n=1 Tax=Mrakia frigida TaxID=29902 RepID=UPI003FCBF500